MNVILFQRVRRREITGLMSPRQEKGFEIEEEVSAILAEISANSDKLYVALSDAAREIGLTPRRMRALYYREARRIEAAEVEALRVLRVRRAGERVRRLERELAVARQIAGEIAA